MPDPSPAPRAAAGSSPAPTRKRVLAILLAAGAVLVVVDVAFRLTGFDKHPYFGWQDWPGFYAVFGYVGCALMILGARFLLRPVAARPDDYYGDDHAGEGGDDHA